MAQAQGSPSVGLCAALYVFVVGCADPALAQLGTVTLAIQGGVIDHQDTAVVALKSGSEICSGVLVAQNAVLTARHCIFPWQGAAEDGSVSCGTTAFASSADPKNTAVSFDLDITRAPSWHATRALFAPSEDGFCGGDVAIVVLAEPAPVGFLEPVLDRAPKANEHYAAVGYGAVDAEGSDYGQRRRRDDLVASCAGSACGDKSVAVAEWLGADGACAGDSGGPALDEDGRVLGIVSRGLFGCSGIVHSTPANHRDWLKDAVVQAALLQDLPAPPWSHCGGESCASGSACRSAEGKEQCVPIAQEEPPPDDGCSFSARRGSGSWHALVALALMAFRSSRARRTDRTRARRCLRSSYRNSDR